MSDEECPKTLFVSGTNKMMRGRGNIEIEYNKE